MMNELKIPRIRDQQTKGFPLFYTKMGESGKLLLHRRLRFTVIQCKSRQRSGYYFNRQSSNQLAKRNKRTMQHSRGHACVWTLQNADALQMSATKENPFFLKAQIRGMFEKY